MAKGKSKTRRQILADAVNAAELAALPPKVQNGLATLRWMQETGQVSRDLPFAEAARQGHARAQQIRAEQKAQREYKAAARELVEAAREIEREGLSAHVYDLVARGGWEAVRNAIGPHLSPAALAMADATVQQAGGFHGLVQGVARASWEILATDPVQLKAFIEERGPDAARAAFEQNGAADLIPVAVKAWSEHAAAQESEAAAAKHQERVAQDPSHPAVRSGLADLLTDPALHQLAAQFYASRGLQPEPGKTALESLIRDASVLEDRTFYNGNRTPGVDRRLEPHEVDAELAKLYKCDVETISTILDVVRDAKTHYGVHKRLAERDRTVKETRPYNLEPDAKDKAGVAGEQGRRAAVEKAFAAAEKRAKPLPSYDLNGKRVDLPVGSVETMTAYNKRKAILAKEYARQTGRDVRLDVTDHAGRELLEREKVREDEHGRHARVRRTVLEAAHDQLAAKPSRERPASTEREWEPRTEAQQGADRRGALEAAWDAGDANTAGDDTKEEET